MKVKRRGGGSRRRLTRFSRKTRAFGLDKDNETKRMMQKIRHKQAEEELAREPHSMVIHRGKIGRFLRKLELDIRTVMEPNTAAKLKIMKRNNLKDFLVNGASLGVTHLVVLSRSEQSVTMRIIRSQQGPTVTFKVNAYVLAKDVVQTIRHPLRFQKQFETAALLVMNGFADQTKKHLLLVRSMLQGMFPALNVDTVKLSTIKRCVIVNYDRQKDVIDLRHYAIRAIPSGASKSATKLVLGKVPDLSKYADISDYFLNPGQLSESEAENDAEVTLPQDLSTRGCKQEQSAKIRLVELGPRLTLSLVKIEEGVDEGEVLYHSYITKTARELTQLRKELPIRKKAKERMRKHNEHRIIRRLEKLAEQRAEETEAEKASRQSIVSQQKSVTGDGSEDVEMNGGAQSYARGRSANDEQRTKAAEEEAAKRAKRLHDRESRTSDGLTRKQRRDRKRAAAAADAQRKLSKKRTRKS